MYRAAIVLSLLLIATPALAQSAYVVGSIGAEVSRLSGVESRGFDMPRGDGEALGGSIRAGMSLGERCGVELEFATADEIEEESTSIPRIFPVPLTVTGPSSFTFTSLPSGPTQGLFPIAINSRLRVRQQNPTVSTVAWIRQRVGGSVDLAYVAGVAFTRSEREQEISFSVLPLPPQPGAPVFAPSTQVTRTTLYRVGPVVGVEAHIGLTEHMCLVPGIRLQGLSGDQAGGWLMRPSVGLGWFF